jgi:hypothetical protein
LPWQVSDENRANVCSRAQEVCHEIAWIADFLISSPEHPFFCSACSSFFFSCLCGGVMAFGFAPAKAIEAYRISRLPVTDSADQVAAAQAGEELLFTAVLSDNPARSDRFDFVA